MIDTNVPPADHETERAVLGAMLISSAALAQALDRLTAKVFFTEIHRLIFSAMGNLFDAGTPVDQVTLTAELRRTGHLDRIGGVVYLAELASEVATAANVDYHGKILLDRYVRRGLQGIGRRMDYDAGDLAVEVEQITTAADAGLSGLVSLRPGGLVKFDAARSEVLEGISAAATRGDELAGLSTGVSSLDARLCGLPPSNLILLAARPSVGKTALACQIALHVAQAHADQGQVLFFSVEMPTRDLATRMLAHQSSIEFNRLRLGRLQDHEWLEITRDLGRFAQLPIQIDETGGLSILEARTRTRLAARKGPVSLVVVDYLQLMSGKGERREEEVSSVSRGLKALAKEIKAPVLALCQLNRAVEQRGSKIPLLSDLRESGSLEQDADAVVFLSDPQGEESPEIEVTIGKSRNGPKGSFTLHYERKFFRFSDMAPSYRVEPPTSAPAAHWEDR